MTKLLSMTLDIVLTMMGECIHINVIRGMYKLPQALILANNLWEKQLQTYGYYQVAHTPQYCGNILDGQLISLWLLTILV